LFAVSPHIRDRALLAPKYLERLSGAIRFCFAGPISSPAAGEPGELRGKIPHRDVTLTKTKEDACRTTPEFRVEDAFPAPK